MRYAPSVTDVEGEHHYPETEGVPDTANNPWDMLEAVLKWCRENNVMPRDISIGDEIEIAELNRGSRGRAAV